VTELVESSSATTTTAAITTTVSTSRPFHNQISFSEIKTQFLFEKNRVIPIHFQSKLYGKSAKIINTTIFGLENEC
jgi:hypothetical protein